MSVDGEISSTKKSHKDQMFVDRKCVTDVRQMFVDRKVSD
jgi:hypothetical protein